jgi:hypothetical protein
MHTLKLKAQITHDRHLEIVLPDDIPEGEVDVVVLIKDSQAQAAAQENYLNTFFNHLENTDIPRRSREEIDHFLEQERADWY